MCVFVMLNACMLHANVDVYVCVCACTRVCICACLVCPFLLCVCVCVCVHRWRKFLHNIGGNRGSGGGHPRTGKKSPTKGRHHRGADSALLVRGELGSASGSTTAASGEKGGGAVKHVLHTFGWSGYQAEGFLEGVHLCLGRFPFPFEWYVLYWCVCVFIRTCASQKRGLIWPSHFLGRSDTPVRRPILVSRLDPEAISDRGLGENLAEKRSSTVAGVLFMCVEIPMATACGEMHTLALLSYVDPAIILLFGDFFGGV